MRQACAEVVQLPGQAEIEDDRLTVPVDHDVARLQVSMNDPAIVRRLHGQRQLAHQQSGLPLGRRFSEKHVRERRPFDVGHRQISDAVAYVEFVDRTEIGMPQRCRRLRLAAEAFHRLQIVGEMANLQRDVAVQARVTGQVDGPHATLAERAENAIRPELLRQRPWRRYRQVGWHGTTPESGRDQGRGTPTS
jgi:hypothetical protein